MTVLWTGYRTLPMKCPEQPSCRANTVDRWAHKLFTSVLLCLGAQHGKLNRYWWSIKLSAAYLYQSGPDLSIRFSFTVIRFHFSPLTNIPTFRTQSLSAYRCGQLYKVILSKVGAQVKTMHQGSPRICVRHKRTDLGFSRFIGLRWLWELPYLNDWSCIRFDFWWRIK